MSDLYCDNSISKLAYAQGQRAQFTHKDNIGEAALECFKSANHCDVTFDVGPEKKAIKCHKFVLMARSPVFEKMFSETWDTSENISLPEVDPVTFHVFLEILYADKYPEDVDISVRVLELGDKYDVRPIMLKCEQILTHNVKLSNSIEIFTVARRYSLGKLMENLGKFMAWFYEDLLGEDSFRDIDAETLLFVVQRNDLRVEELKLFKSLMRWAEDNNAEDSKCSEVSKKLLSLVRYPLMTVQDFSTVVVPAKILSSVEVIALFQAFTAVGQVKTNAERRILFSFAPRIRPITLSLYIADQLGSDFQFHPNYDVLEYRSGHEEILEISYGTIETGTGTMCSMRLVSLMLELNYKEVVGYCQPSMISELELQIQVSLQEVGTCGVFSTLFEEKCFLPTGQQFDMNLFPQITLLQGKKYRLKVIFQGSVLIIKQCGQRDVDWNYDMLTCSSLTSELSDPGMVGRLQLGITQPPSEVNPHRISPFYYGPRALHIVKGITVVEES